jgi:hypothetical protein
MLLKKISVAWSGSKVVAAALPFLCTRVKNIVKEKFVLENKTQLPSDHGCGHIVLFFDGSETGIKTIYEKAWVCRE